MTKKTGKRNKQVLLIVFMVVVVAGLAFLFFNEEGSEPEKIKASAQKPAAAAPRAEEGSAARTMKTVKLYFLSDDDAMLHAEDREIAADPSVVREATAVVEELIKGSKKGYVATIPPEVKLRQIFITKDGTATVDFSREFVDKHPSGTSAEMATVYSVVNSLALNFPSIKQIIFLVEGAEKETLGGHINLSKPFASSKSMVVE